MPIPREIVTIWLNDNNEWPELIQKCIASQKELEKQGYTHKVITLENCSRKSQYVRDALAAKKWVKAADYLRMEYAYENGCIYLDADTEVLPGKNFDDMLDNWFFIARENHGYLANGIFGSIAGHPLTKEYLRRVDANFKGDGDLIFEPGMRLFGDVVYASDPATAHLTIYDGAKFFYPYNHETGLVNVTEDTKTYHHYLKSWKN